MTKGKGDYYYKMEFDAWDEGTVDLTLEEEAAYLRLCHQMYRRRGPVPNSDRLLMSLWRCHQNKARPLLQKLIAAGKIFVTSDGYLSNTRVTQEVDARETLSTRRAHAGQTGGTRSGDVRSKSLKSLEVNEAKSPIIEEIRGEERRVDKTIEDQHPSGAETDIVVDQVVDDQSLGSSSQSQPEPSANQLSLLEPENRSLPPSTGTALITVARPAKPVISQVVEAFDVWWSAYPLKKSKIKAAKRYAEVVKARLATETELLDGALRYAAEQAGVEPRFIKHPTTWLTGGCWADEPSQPTTNYRSQPQSRADSAIDGMRAFLEENYDESAH